MNDNGIEIGQVFGGRFAIIGMLGEGGGGTVYEVRDLTDMSSKALKTIKIDRDGNQEFRAELDTLGKLQPHQGIPNLYGSGSQGIWNYYATDKLLHDLWYLSANNPNESQAVGSNVLLALSYHMYSIMQHVHSKGFIHRDVKLANFMLKVDHKNHECPISLIDFGTSITVPNDPTPMRDSRYAECTYATPRMMDGYMANKQDDLLMITYCILDLDANDCFDVVSGAKKNEVLPKKRAFELNPMELQNYRWLAEIVREIVSKEGNGEYNYSRILSIIKREKRNFDPATFKFDVKTNEAGKMYL